MPRATLNGVTLAESEHTEIVEGNHYFPPGAVNRDLFRESAASTHCPWKGDASRLSVEVDGTRGDPGRGRGLVLPRAHAGGGEYQGPRRLLRQQGGGRGVEAGINDSFHRLVG